MSPWYASIVLIPCDAALFVAIRGVLAVFAERRQDRNGPYVVLRCVTLN
ncbi:DUF987 family protein [Salmonella enterica subsp. enterica serovar Brijbhumi]|nr:DUF987 family protein [Salmonella enterica subsp. enterica serovar Brijbhumi]